MELLAYGLIAYALMGSSKPSSTQQAAAQQPAAKPPGSNFATDLGSFVGGLIAGAVSKYGEDDKP
jgi:predicted lipid-binding transport protein (Tim44 family)